MNGIFIANYDGRLPELNACLGEYESLDELNHLAAYSPSWIGATWKSLKR